MTTGTCRIAAHGVLGRPWRRIDRALPGALRHLGMAALVALGAGLAPVPAAADTHVPAPETYELDGRELRLYGQGIRTVAWIEAYHCALYLPAGAEPPNAGRPRPEAIAFRVTVLAQDDDPDMPDEWRAAMQAEVSERLLERMREAYGRLEKGDVITLGYAEGGGTRVWHNGKLMAHPDGPDLMRAVVGMWLGDEPVSHSLRAALLNREGDDGGLFSSGGER